MPTKIHAQAIVEEGAQLGENVIVEAFALIGKSAIIGDHSIVRHHATVEGKTFVFLRLLSDYSTFCIDFGARGLSDLYLCPLFS